MTSTAFITHRDCWLHNMGEHHPESPERLAARAREIGLVPGVNPVFLRPADGRILGVPTPARTPAARAGAAR